MFAFKALAGSSIVALSILATTAQADVTPNQVWDNWQAYLEGYGYTVTARSAQSGNALTLSDIILEMDLPEDEGSLRVLTGPMTLTDMGDGTVGIAIPPKMGLTLDIDPESNDPLKMTMTYSHSGLEMFATGSPENLGFDLTATMLGLALTDLEIAGEKIGTAKMDVVMHEVSGSSTMQTDQMREVSQILSAKSLTYDLAVADPEGSGNLVLKGSAAAPRMDTQMFLPLQVPMDDMSAALKAGLSMQSSFDYADGDMQFSFVDGGESASGSSSSKSGSLDFYLSQKTLRYATRSAGAVLALNGSDIPIPINLSIAELAMTMLMPIAESTEPEDFRLLVKLAGIAPDNMIWGMFDPTGALPHDPATLAVDIAGKANWLFDIFDPKAAEKLFGPPGEIHSVTIEQLDVSAVGANLSGNGDFTFDNNNLMSFDGMPAPTGSADLKLVGANTLIDKLMAIGLLTEEDAFGARMMMAVMARPSDDPDTLTSTLEVKADGTVFANGMQLQ